MGQYYKIVNYDKQEYITPPCFHDGRKLMEFACSANGTMTALAVLLVDPETNGRGGGDFMGNDPYDVVGRWFGDRIGIVGDYGDDELYDKVEISPSWKDISQEVLDTIIQDVSVFKRFAYIEGRKALLGL